MNELMKRNSLFDDFWRDFSPGLTPGFFVRPLHGDALPSQIKIDVSEGDEGYTVQAEIPGVKKDDIHITIDGNQVTLSAEIKQFDSKSQDDRVLRSERYYGAVSRSFQLGNEIDQANAKARYNDGVLTLTLPKKTGSGTQRLRVE